MERFAVRISESQRDCKNFKNGLGGGIFSAGVMEKFLNLEHFKKRKCKSKFLKFNIFDFFPVEGSCSKEHFLYTESKVFKAARGRK
ncbi:MAG: hypothetical protein D6797_03705, partial [Bdellovibrio sp.]